MEDYCAGTSITVMLESSPILVFATDEVHDFYIGSFDGIQTSDTVQNSFSSCWLMEVCEQVHT